MEQSPGTKCGQTASHHPEDAVAHPFLKGAGHHPWKHHPQGHEGGADGIMRCLMRASGKR